MRTPLFLSHFNEPLILGGTMKLPKELDHPRKRLINIQNTDNNECFKWCLVRYLNTANRNPARITTADKDFAKNLILKTKLQN